MDEAARLPLRGLQADAEYVITELDTNESTKARGRPLMTEGLRVAIQSRPDSAVLVYKRASTR